MAENCILDIAHGGTGSDVKCWVDLSTNQFDIAGVKIFVDPCAFQGHSDIVDCGEPTGLRIISCDPQGEDIGPQLRFSGHNTDGDPTAFAFATIAGRKENGTSGDKSGYLQFSTTTDDGHILEAARIDSEQVFGIGTRIPTKGLDNRLWVSRGDIFLDNCEGNRSYKVQITGEGTSGESVYGRMQSVVGLDVPTSSHLFFGNNIKFDQTASDRAGCVLDDSTYGSAAVELRVNTHSTDLNDNLIRFWTGDPAGCPQVRGQFFDGGLIVFGDSVAGVANIPDGPLDGNGTRGNTNLNNPSFYKSRLAGDNIQFGSGNPEGIVNAPIGAIYGNNTPTTAGDTFFVKIDNDYGPTGWRPVSLDAPQDSICLDDTCPVPDTGGTQTKCPVWFDQTNNMLWYWHSKAKQNRAGDTAGAWVSSNVYQVTQQIPLGQALKKRAVAQEFRGWVDKHYINFTPTHILRNLLEKTTGRFDLYLVDLVVCLRVAWNSPTSKDPSKHFYLFDLVSIKRRQGDPIPGATTKQEWPGDRATEDEAAFPSDADADSDNPDGGEVAKKTFTVRGFGHTYHTNLPKELTARSMDLTSLNDPIEWYGTVAADATNNKKFTFTPDTQSDLDGNSTAWTVADSDSGTTPGSYKGYFKYNVDRPKNFLSKNNGYQIVITDYPADPTLVGMRAMISSMDVLNGPSYSINLLRPFYNFDTGAAVKLKKDMKFQITDAQYRRIIARVSTKGNIWPLGPYSNKVTKDIQDYVMTGADATATQENSPGGFGQSGTGGGSTYQVPLDYYMNVASIWDNQNRVTGGGSGTDGADSILGTPLDAMMLSGLWDAVGSPGKISGSVSLTFRLALPENSCSE